MCENLEFYTNGKVKFNITWATRKLESLFEIKDNAKHLSCIIYQGICSCGQNYIGQTIRNAVTRKDENEQPNGKPEPSKQAQEVVNYSKATKADDPSVLYLMVT